MKNRITHIGAHMPKPPIVASGELTKCQTCRGSGMVYEDRPYVVMGRHFGSISEMVPCPDCSGGCRTCGGSGYIRYDVPRDHAEYGKLHFCPNCAKGQLEQQTSLNRLLKHAQLPAHYAGLTFETWDRLAPEFRAGKELARAAAGLFVKAARQGYWVSLNMMYRQARLRMPGDLYEVNRNWLVFQGDVGLGKTGLAAAIANYLLSTNQAVLYARAFDLIKEIQDRYSDDREGTADSLRDQIQRVPLLIIDEANIRGTSNDRMNWMESILRYRHGNQLPTILTLNKTQSEFEEEWGVQTASVVRSNAHWIEFGGYPIRDERGALVEHWSNEE